MSIRTKSGDQGFSDLRSGRVQKSNPIFECLGDLDELSACLGLCGECQWLQTALLDLGSDISGYAPFKHSLSELKAKLEELNSDAQAGVICSRAEHHFWAIPDAKPELGKWINCLSNFLNRQEPVAQCLDDLHELKCCLSVCGDYPWLQEALSDLRSNITGTGKFTHSLTELEARLKELEDRLPVLKNFILPDNKLHMARAICRRAERHFWAIPDAKPELGKWLNCLSDFLFQEARSKSDGDVRYKQSKGTF